MRKHMLVFDPKLWKESGYDSGDNSQFMKEAEILETYWYDGELVATVRFIHSDRIAYGHFVRDMEEASIYA